MKKFNFRLAVVERHRKLKEQEKQVLLAKSLEQMKNTEKKLLDLDKREVKARKDFARLGDPSNQSEVSPAKFWLIDQFIQGQKVRRLDLKKKLADEEVSVQFAYREFLGARQQKKIMETLREKKELLHIEENKKKEAHVQDELYVTRGVRSKGLGINAEDEYE